MRNYVLAGLSILLIFVGMTLDYRTESQIAQHTTSVVLTPQQMAMSELFKRHGSPQPDEMAVAISHVKPVNQALLAAVAIVESNADPTSVGDNGASLGAFQVQPQHWGAVSNDPVQQALQAERILEDLLASQARGRLRCALARYNGGTKPPRASYRYADRVISLTKKGATWSASYAATKTRHPDARGTPVQRHAKL